MTSKILIIGSGGREHTLAWKIKQSSLAKKVYCAPGNGGISEIAECVDIKADDIQVNELYLAVIIIALRNPLGLLGFIDDSLCSRASPYVTARDEPEDGFEIQFFEVPFELFKLGYLCTRSSAIEEAWISPLVSVKVFT